MTKVPASTWLRPPAAAVMFAAMALAAPAGAGTLDKKVHTFLQVEQLEYRADDNTDVLQWDAGGWIGNDEHKIAFKTEGEKPLGKAFEAAELQLLYRRPISDFFDAHAGARFDFRPQPETAYGVFGVSGLAPMFIETDASLFVSEAGDVSLRIEAEREFLITQRLILQPSAEMHFAFTEDPAIESGAGVNDLELGLRLRYELAREFAPYVGVHWEKKFGATKRFAEAEGETTEDLLFVAGLRFWF